VQFSVQLPSTLRAARSRSFFLYRQGLHLALLLLLIVVSHALAAPKFGPPEETLFGLGDRAWFRLTIAVVVAHQMIVAAVFRGQLGWGTMTRLFGRFDMVAWGAIFLPFLAARPLLALATAAVDAGSLELPPALAVGTGAALLLPAAYAAWSVGRYFGIPRALGGDHFRTHYRKMPMVRGGAFAWTPNAMYALVFLGLWSIALLARSHVALVGALFQHAYIWVHYYCTEKPDMDLIYGSGG